MIETAHAASPRDLFELARYRALQLDVIYFQPAPDVKRRLTLADVLDSNRDVFRKFNEMSRSLSGKLPGKQLRAERARIFESILVSEGRWVVGTQRMILEMDDKAEISDKDIETVSTALRLVEISQSEGRMILKTSASNLVDAALSETFGKEIDTRRTMRLNFIAAHGTGRSSRRMIEKIPFPKLRKILADWRETYDGPMARATISHTPLMDSVVKFDKPQSLRS